MKILLTSFLTMVTISIISIFANKISLTSTSIAPKENMNMPSAMLEGMLAHHYGAIFMSEDALSKSKRNEIKNLAYDLIRVEAKNIEEVYKWRREWFGQIDHLDPYRFSQDDTLAPKLPEYSQEYDKQFLTAMIAHHEAAIKMLGSLDAKVVRPELINFAQIAKPMLEKDVELMNKYIKEWYE